ncbi:MAG: glycoside hydrolase [Selenomonas ruminantium]|nr:glycoside hydrolase [Selenomonas ruminantium]
MSKALRIMTLSVILMCWFAMVAAASAFRVGDQGSDVAEIQGQLASLGYDVAADGDFGPATAEAVKAFQAAHGLDADGLVGPSTYTALLGKEMPEVSRGSNYISRRVVADSMRYIGVPYVFGGTTPSGFDCSGYVRYVFAQAGIYLPRMADEQYECGYPVSTDELVAGDLVFFSTYDYGASHVGIYLGDGSFINASSSRGVVIDSLYSSYWGSCYIGARRVM